MTTEIFLLRLAILYAIAHIVVFIVDFIRYRTLHINLRFFWNNESYSHVILNFDIILLTLVLCVNFIMTGNPFELWNG